MAEILLSTLMDALGGPIPADAVLTATATSPRTDGATVIANQSVTVKFVGGVPTAPFVLDYLGPAILWHCVLRVSPSGIRIERHVAVPDVPSVEWADLVDVDPATLLPAEGAVPAWTAAVGQVAAALADTNAARDQAGVSAGIADARATDAEAARVASEAARAGSEAARDTSVAASTTATTKAAEASANAAAAEAAKLAAQAVGDTSDTIMTNVAADPSSLFTAQLNATYVQPHANTVVMIGSSIEEQNGDWLKLDATGGSSNRARGWFHWANAFLGGRMNLVKNAGVGGDRYDQMRARFTTDALAHPSSWVFIGSATNSVSGGYSAASIIADLDAMLDAAISAGRRVLVHTVPPRGSLASSAAKLAVQSAVNKYVRMLPLTRPGVLAADTYAAIVNAATAAPRVGTTTDDTHPSIAGAALIGRVTAGALQNVMPPVPMPTTSDVDPASAIGNTSLIGGTGWAAVGAASGLSFTDPASDGQGAQAKFTIAGNASRSATIGILHSELLSDGRFAPGDVVQGTFRVRWSNLVPLATAETAECIPNILVRFKTGATITNTTYGLYSASSEWLSTLGEMPSSGEIVLTTWPATVGPTIDGIDVIIGWRGAASVTTEIEHVSVLKL